MRCFSNDECNLSLGVAKLWFVVALWILYHFVICLLALEQFLRLRLTNSYLFGFSFTVISGYEIVNLSPVFE
ncbi:hypothetical protein RJT34_18111 [Clitoria ternatea]|uniref:Uncharacterized protein n=1 Tax=Clitoria ternatea TaxID=43366 RepID=A0AAN9PEA8_CLITE